MNKDILQGLAAGVAFILIILLAGYAEAIAEAILCF